MLHQAQRDVDGGGSSLQDAWHRRAGGTTTESFCLLKEIAEGGPGHQNFGIVPSHRLVTIILELFLVHSLVTILR